MRLSRCTQFAALYKHVLRLRLAAEPVLELARWPIISESTVAAPRLAVFWLMKRVCLPGR
jgi:hypothetical protein